MSPDQMNHSGLPKAPDRPSGRDLQPAREGRQRAKRQRQEALLGPDPDATLRRLLVDQNLSIPAALRELMINPGTLNNWARERGLHPGTSGVKRVNAGLFLDHEDLIAHLPPRQREAVTAVVQTAGNTRLENIGRQMGGISRAGVSDLLKRAGQNLERLKRGETIHQKAGRPPKNNLS